MILSRSAILTAMKTHTLGISPFSQKNLGPASYDLTLSNEFRVFSHTKTVDVKEDTNYRHVSSPTQCRSIVLGPQEFMLGITKETITLPPNICGWLSGRSRFARLGLTIHITANFVQPGVSNKQVLEIRNLSSMPLRLHAGVRICHIVFEQMDGDSVYKGKFKRQNKI